MRLLPSLCVFWLLPLASMLEKDLPLNHVSHTSVPFHRNNAHLFSEKGVFNYTTMLLREDLNLLVLGAKESIYALDLKDISKKLDSVKWEVTKQQETDCSHKGKQPETECKNYIRILHKMKDDRMYVCGTNAFAPLCDYMSYADGKLSLEKKREDGKGKCPFDPFQRYDSVMVDNDLYSATYNNFGATEPILSRGTIRTEPSRSWLYEPTFVSMAHMPESEGNEDGDDDKVYLFFSEKPCNCIEMPEKFSPNDGLVFSRVARVCKGDLGGKEILVQRWTSFIKARIDCPVLESKLPSVIQDSYRWCDPRQNWRNCLFYGIFTPQLDTKDSSAVCVYRVSDISNVFAKGRWRKTSEKLVTPRPGACINNAARKAGITQTLDLPDRTLQFIKDKNLMDQTIQPIDQKPLLVREGARFTRIVVDQVQDADGKKHRVMFIGTEAGTVLKAVNYDGEMFIIEEVQLFQPPNAIKILKISNVMGQLYAGSDVGVAQIPLATCERSSSCMRCVLARDPYCGWDKDAGKCIALSQSQRHLIQSVKEGKYSLCPPVVYPVPTNQFISPGGYLKLSCTSPSNVTKISWDMNNGNQLPSAKLQLLPDGLLIVNASHRDSGRYRCLSVEQFKTVNYTTVLAEYQVSVAPTGSHKSLSPLKDGHFLLQVVVAPLVGVVLALLAWNLYKGHIPLPCKCGQNKVEQAQGTWSGQDEHVNFTALRPDLAEDKPLVSRNSSSNSHGRREAGFSGPKVNLQCLQYADESES